MLSPEIGGEMGRKERERERERGMGGMGGMGGRERGGSRDSLHQIILFSKNMIFQPLN